jgi:DNA-binding MarR family transcriptional regulator
VTGSKRLVLSIRPRNAEESELTLERGEDLRWTVVGEDERAQLGETRQRILSLLEFAAEPLGSAEVAARLAITEPNARQHLSKMVKGKLVERVSLGQYRALPAHEVA